MTETKRHQASHASAYAWRLADALWVLALGVVGAFLNLHAPTVFFDSQIMLGGALVVFALLRFGWWGSGWRSPCLGNAVGMTVPSGIERTCRTGL